MENKLKELRDKIGLPYQMIFDDGNYLGCFYPVYFLYPDLPRFPLPSMNLTNPKNFNFGIDCILGSFEEVEKADIEAGDMFACEFKKELHVGILISDKELIHIFRGHDLRVAKLSIFDYKDLRFFRVKK